MDIPDLDESFQQASEELTKSEETETTKEVEEETSEDKPVEEEAEESKEETEDDSKKESEEESKEDAEESFAEKGDLQDKSPKELEEIYKNWQRSYTVKRQAETKELEDLRNQLADKKPEVDKPEPSKPMDQMSPQEYAQYVADLAKEEVRVSKNNSYIESQEKAFYGSDDRLNKDDPTFDQNLHDLVVMRLANNREAHTNDGKSITDFNFVDESQKLIKAYDENIKNLKEQYLQKQSKIARTRSKDFAKQSPKTSAAKSKNKMMDIDESLEAAMSG